MDSIFTKIIKGEIPAYIIAEDDNFIAFLDVFPLVEGHTLVIPKQQVDYIFNLDDSTLAGLNVFAKKIALAIEKSVSCKRIGTAVIGLEVPHAHIHLIPIQHVNDIDFSRKKLSFTPNQFQNTLDKIKQNL
jgi:histidine triad (HIT) family protein